LRGPEHTEEQLAGGRRPAGNLTPGSRRPRRPYTIRDQVALRRLEGLAASPDGRRIVLRIGKAIRGRNRLDHRLWRLDPDGRVRPLTPAGGNDANPVMSPDGGHVYYISGRKQHRQVLRIPIEGGQPEQVTHAPIEVDSFVLARDGRRIAFSAMVFPGGPDTLAATKKRIDERNARPSTGQVHDQLMIRHWDEWKTGQRRHVFVQDVSGGPAGDVMPDMDADSPVKPFGGTEQLTFTPDGRGVVFTARDVGREEAWSTDLDLFLAPADGSAPPVKLTTENRATDTDPAFSPDGTWLAYLAMDRPGDEADKQTVMVRAWPGGPTRRLTDGWDRSAESLAWSADGRTLYVTADDLGQTGLFAIDPADGSVTPVVADGRVTQVVPVADRVLYIRDSVTSPADLFEAVDGQLRRLTALNGARMRRLALGEAEQFTFAGWNDETVYAYLLKPANFDPSRRYPIAFIVHGGPESSFGNHWGYRWNPQVYAGAGYATIFIDFHGSPGYGQAFTDSIRNDWGGKPLEDLRKGWAAALERYPFLDAGRASALGASFGGYMVNLIAGVWNEPWRCLVSHDGNLDERFAYFATEELWFAEWEHGGTPWEHPDGYARHNPLNHVASWRVPMLVIHGARDYRVTEVEGFAVFTALQRRGIPSRLLYFPDENHWVTRPQNSIQWHDTVLEWLARWNKD
jgi:dipeptidyl aminopeptidase/acylaminoacyl peptidase